MNSKKLAAIGLLLAVMGAPGVPLAQIRLDTTYVATGARPFDEPIDPGLYLIRPGEKLEVVFLGAKLPKLSLQVNSEGRLVHAELGLFELAGRTLAQVRQDLMEPLQRLYRADEIVISVSTIYPVAIQVTGMVNRPGTFMGYTSQRVSEIIDSAGGVAPGGSTRWISFVGGPTRLEVDLDRFRYLSDLRRNPCLYAGLRVSVPERKEDEVQVTGAVVDPRAIEFRPDENVRDLILLAGGELPGVRTAAPYLINNPDKSIVPPMRLEAGDIVFVPEAENHPANLQVKLFGLVSGPGVFAFTEGMTLAGLLRSGGDLEPEANSARITVFRLREKDGGGRRPAGRYPLMPADADGVARLALRAGDSVFVPRLVGYVSIAGLVGRPGLVPYTAGHTVEDYIRLAGGFFDSESEPLVDISDRISGLTRAATMRAVIYDGDLITVRMGEED